VILSPRMSKNFSAVITLPLPFVSRRPVLSVIDAGDDPTLLASLDKDAERTHGASSRCTQRRRTTPRRGMPPTHQNPRRITSPLCPRLINCELVAQRDDVPACPTGLPTPSKGPEFSPLALELSHEAAPGRHRAERSSWSPTAVDIF
jgi:hypothetical protein